VNGYFDTSALVAVALAEAGFERVAACQAALGDGYASAIGYVELRSALAAARRASRGTVTDPDDDRRLADELWDELTEIAFDPEIAATAVRAILDHGLHALDAIHLASALMVAGAEPLAMVSLDRRLRRAAAAEGLIVLPEAA
jgi:predicted nucleic acid-binding protein